jgi:hypothetical protein
MAHHKSAGGHAVDWQKDCNRRLPQIVLQTFSTTQQHCNQRHDQTCVKPSLYRVCATFPDNNRARSTCAGTNNAARCSSAASMLLQADNNAGRYCVLPHALCCVGNDDASPGFHADIMRCEQVLQAAEPLLNHLGASAAESATIPRLPNF